MMRRGFVLLAVLWLIVVAGGSALLLVTDVRTESGITRNRWLLTRSRWAAEACVAIARDALARGHPPAPGREQLGRGTVCAWHFENPAALLHVGVADRTTLERFLGRNGMASGPGVQVVDTLIALRTARPLTDVRQLDQVPGFPERLRRFTTVMSEGLVDLRAAPPEVVVALPGLSDEAVAALGRRRALGGAFGSLLELSSWGKLPRQVDI